jgi:hypothetical protein
VTSGNRVQTALSTPPTGGNGDQSGDKTSTDWWLIVFTGFLVLVGGLQYWAMRKQASYMRQANVYTRGNLRAAIRNAEAAKRQAVSLDATLIETRKSADAAKKSADVAEQSLTLLNRPQLVFQSPELNNFAPMPIVGQVSLITVNYEFHNYGAGLAWIIETCVVVEAKPAGEMPDPPIYKGRRIERPPIVVTFDKGNFSFRYLSPVPMLDEAAYRAIAIDRSSYLSIYGYVRYLDILNHRWKMGFCWVYEPPGGFNLHGYWKPSGPDSYHYNVQEED